MAGRSLHLPPPLPEIDAFSGVEIGKGVNTGMGREKESLP